MKVEEIYSKNKKVIVFVITNKTHNKPKQTKTEVYESLEKVEWQKYKSDRVRSIIEREHDIAIKVIRKK